MRYAFDIDNTLFHTEGNDYKGSTPIQSRINYVNKLHDKGHYIILYTARGRRSGIDYSQLTKEQADKFGIKYHEIVMGKLDYDLFVDDKAISTTEFDKIILDNAENSIFNY
jgi:hypothetical protein